MLKNNLAEPQITKTTSSLMTATHQLQHTQSASYLPISGKLGGLLQSYHAQVPLAKPGQN